MTIEEFHRFGTNVVVSGALAMWVVLAARAPGARNSRRQRRLLIAVAGLAGSITVYLDPVTALLTRTYVFGESCSITMNIWGVISSALVLDFVLAAVSRRRPWLVYGASVVVSIALILFNADLPQAGCVTSTAVPWYSPFWWLLCVSHVVAVGPCAWLCARYARRATARSVRAGLWLLAAGFTSSTIFWSFVVLGYTMTDAPWLGASFDLNIGVTAWLTAAGIALPLFVQVARLAGNLRALRRLDPLWTDLTGIVPQVRLPEPSGPRWSVEFRLYRRVIEIRDALLVLRDYVDESTVTAARVHVDAAMPVSDDTDAIVTACWVAAAERAKADGAEPAASARAEHEQHISGDELAGEIAFLSRLAEVRGLPLVAEFAARPLPKRAPAEAPWEDPARR